MKVEKHLTLLEFLAYSTIEQRKVLIKALTEEQLKVVLEAIYNVLFGTCPIEKALKKKLSSNKTVIRRMVSKDLTPKQQQRLLKKHSDLLPFLLKPVVEMFKST